MRKLTSTTTLFNTVTVSGGGVRVRIVFRMGADMVVDLPAWTAQDMALLRRNGVWDGLVHRPFHEVTKIELEPNKDWLRLNTKEEGSCG